MDMQGFIEWLKERLDTATKVKDDFNKKGEWREALYTDTRINMLKDVISMAEIWAKNAEAAS